MLIESWQIVVALSSSGVVVIGGSVAFWRRALTRARKDGKERGVLYHKLDDITEAIKSTGDHVENLRSDIQSVRNVAQDNSVAISRLEGKMSTHMMGPSQYGRTPD